eukprot:TRINITY_DN27142_c0_g1_i2.p1 TRINITY_DN27142_c0_g1~~TRINITY_DN27142_c0_g1_i2.p1  ORF type:complete len:315 (-),score=49.03 TRINITY_DN27142_c0_g1_i2:54-998(-)
MKVLNVYLVRHGESENNSRGNHDERCGDVAALSTESGQAPSAKRRKVNESETDANGGQSSRMSSSSRQPDPGLTSRGKAQADAVAQLMRSIRDDPKTEPRLRPHRLFTSGFLRALETCRPVSEALQLAPQLHADLHEEGGIFEGPRRGQRLDSYPVRHGLTAREMCEALPGITGIETVPERGWWVGGQESSADTLQRAERCSEWLWQMAEETGDGGSSGAVVCITHGLFMDKLIKALGGIAPGTGSTLFLSANCSYWLVQLRVDPSAALSRMAVMAACNVVDHVPMEVRTGHNMCGVSHCQPSYEDPHAKRSAA